MTTARVALALVATTAASVTAIATHHTQKRPASASALAPVLPLSPRASRSHEREPLPRVTSKPKRQRPHLAVVSEDVSATAYCATGSPTASGKWPQIGMAAGNRWPLGTRLHVIDYGDVVVEDRIGWGSDLDLFFGNDSGCEQRALNFGRRHLRVVVER